MSSAASDVYKRQLIFVLEISALFCMYVELDEKIKKLCKNGIIRPKVEVFV